MTHSDDRRTLNELLDRLWGQARDIERQWEDAVRRAVAKLQVPKREQLHALHVRLNHLEQRLRSLEW